MVVSFSALFPRLLSRDLPPCLQDPEVELPAAIVVTELIKERVSSGVKRLDTMLGGGYYRGASEMSINKQDQGTA